MKVKNSKTEKKNKKISLKKLNYYWFFYWLKKILDIVLKRVNLKIKRYFTVPVHTKARYHLFGFFIASFCFSVFLFLGGYNIYKKVFANNESIKSMPTDLAFNVSGYSDGEGMVAVFSNEVRIATSSAWMDGAYFYKKQINLKNLSSTSLATASAQITVNTKELYDAGKLQADCDDLRVAFVATESANLRQELPRTVITASGATDCSDSVATLVTFPLKETLWPNGGIDSNYELYYGNPNASYTNTSRGFDLLRADGSTASATLVCPFNGTTTCYDQDGPVSPTTATGAIRYSGGKGALEFRNKVNSPLRLTNFSLEGENQVTLELWVYQEDWTNIPSSGIVTNPAFIAYGGRSGGNLNIRPYIGGNPSYTDKVYVEVNGQISTTTTMSGTGWKHFALVYDGSKARLYVDGTLKIQFTPSVTGALQEPEQQYLDVGNLYCCGSTPGRYDEIRVSNVVRYTSNFTPQTTPFLSDQYTKVLWHLDENGDDPRNSGKVIDASGNGNHGTIYGAKYVSGLVGVDSASSDTGAISIQPYAGHQGVFIEEGTTNLIINPSFENSEVYNKYWFLPYFNYATASATFTANMAKRNSDGPFAAGVMVGGKIDNSGNSDVISFSTGNQLKGLFKQNLDLIQGSIVFWITPEWNGNDSKDHYIINAQDSGSINTNNALTIYKAADNKLYGGIAVVGNYRFVSVDASSWIAGTTYQVVFRWDTKNTLDGTNYASLSVNDSHINGITAYFSTPFTISSNLYIGSKYDGTLPANAIIEGLIFYRRPLFDGQYGIDIGNGDEIAQIYNNGSGKDPTLVTGSWDIVFDLPTNASTGQLTSGTGNAWSHPHSSNLLYTNTTNTGGFMMNGTYTSDGWAYQGTPTSVLALATNEKIFAGGYKFTTDEANEGIKYTKTGLTVGSDYVVRALAHSDGTAIPKIQIWDTVNNHEITQMTATSANSTRTSPEVFIFTFELPYVSRYGGQPGYDWVTSNCYSIEVRLLNAASSGTVYWHQVEVLPNLIDNPSMEVGSGDPWIPGGWINGNGTLSAGESIQDTSNKKSGISSVGLRGSGALWRSSISLINFNYYFVGLWTTGLYKGNTWLNGGCGTGNAYWQNTYSSQFTIYPTNGRSENNFGIFRFVGTGCPRFDLIASTDFNVDDLYLIPLTSVSLTVTPANQSNSTETTGLRIDGADTLTQPITGWTEASGSAKFKFTPRHSFSVADKFGFSQPVIASAAASTNNNYLKLYKQSSSVLRLEGKFNGKTVTADWSNPTLDAGTTYNIEIGYSQNYGLWLTVDGVERARATGVVPFSEIPTTMYFGSDGQGSNQYDSTYTSFVSLTPTENTTAPYYKFGSKSVKLVAYDREDLYTIAATASASTTHTLSAYVYDGTSGNIGGTVDSSVAQLASASATLSTTYTDMGGGWWRLTTSPSLPAGTHYLGVQVKPGKTVYVDGVQLEQKSYATTYADGSLGTGYSWSGEEGGSGSSRSADSISYASAGNISGSTGSLSFWTKPKFWTYGNLIYRQFIQIGNWVVHYQQGTFPGNNNYWGIKTGSDSPWATKQLDFINDKWVNVVITWNGSQMVVYANGSAGTPISYSTGLSASSININNTNADSALSDFRIFDKALTVDEVSKLYYQGLSTHQSGSESDDRYESGTYTYISPVIDLSANGAWGTTPIAFTDFLNGGTITYYTRTSPDNSTWSDWTLVSENNIASDPRRYFQWKAELTPNEDLNDSPVIKGMTLTYVEDTTAPQNPTEVALGYTNSASSSATLVSGTWYNYPKPKFTWEAGEDVAAEGQSVSGIDGYHILLTTEQDATPSANLGDPCYLWTESDQRQFIVGSLPSSCSLDDGIYYLRLQTKDNSGNVSDPVTLFTYKYDGSIPNAPSSAATSNIGYQAVNSFTFFWPAAFDNGPSGLKGYEYRTGDPSSTWTFTTTTSVSDIQAYQEGQNFFYVRSVDNAGNYSGETSNNIAAGTFYYNQSAPTAPKNVVITPETSASSPASNNVFTVTWDKPESYSGEIAKYYYCVNCTPSASTMTETTASETINRRLENMALATQQGKNTFYIVAEDNNINTSTGHGNRNFEAYAAVDFYASTVAPAAPTSLTISDASDKQNSLWRLTLVWKAPTTGGTPAKYDIYRSTDNSSFSFVGSVTSTAYTDTDLEYNKLYYYKVKALDNAGSSSIFSNTVSLAPVGKYYDPPSSGGIPSSSCGSTICTISWTTSRETYGTVEYGKTTSYGSAASESTATKTHSIKISGLAPGTTYHFRVLVLDEASLVGYDRSQAYSSDYSFTTLNTAAISNIVVSDITLSSAIISWKTSSLSTSKVEYGETLNYGEIIEVSNVASESAHMVKLSNLKHSNTYHFRVRGTTIDGDDIFSEDNSFSTLVFPKVSAVVFNTEQGEGGTSVVLAWATNIKTTSEVEYQAAEVDKSQNLNAKNQNLKVEELQKLSPTELAKIPIIPKGKNQTVYNLEFNTHHIQRISGLNDGTIYIFTIRGRDEFGNQVVSDPIRYVTGADTKPPVIKNVIIETPISGVGTEAKSQIIVSWETDEPAVGQVIWGQGTGSEYPFASEKDQNYTTKHVIILRDLTPTTSYHLKILSYDKNSNKIESQDTVVVTPSAQQAAFDIIIKNLEDIFGFLKI